MKSHEEFRTLSSLTSIAIALLKDAMAKCSMSIDPRDVDTISRRIEYEGLSFLTKTLPAFGRDIEECLDLGGVTPSHFRMFRKCKAIPAFLQGMLGLVFSQKDGSLIHEPSIEAIEGLRQMSYAFKKLKLDYTHSQTMRATSSFMEEESSIESFVLGFPQQRLYNSVCHGCWYDICGNNSIRDMVPRHGPGAVAERLSANAKFALKRWHYRLEPYFPYYGNAVHNESVYCDENYDSSWVEVPEEQEQPVRVVFVPKDSKGPRTIAVEPACMQYTQQAISRSLIEWLEHAPLTAGHVNFTDQSINQRLAIVSSEDKSFATIDLSSASDRVPRDLALAMFQYNPDLMEAIDASRSRSALLPDGNVIPLRKFASMGSALCFPVESMFFFTLCVMSLLDKRGLPVTPQNCKIVSRDVFVYGDDIIVPTKDVDAVIRTLQDFNCKVNTTKSHWKGYFRESCGVDAYRGHVVTPTYLRELPPYNRRCSRGLISWTETSNQLYKRGYWHTANLLIMQVERILGELPIVQETCSGLGKLSFQRFPYSIGRWDKRSHVNVVKTWVPKPVYHDDKLEGYPALLKCLLRLQENISEETDSKHLLRTARHGAVTLKRQWVRPY